MKLDAFVANLSNDDRLAIIKDREAYERGEEIPSSALDRVTLDLLRGTLSGMRRSEVGDLLVSACHRHRSLFQVPDIMPVFGTEELEAKIRHLRALLEGRLKDLRLISIENGEIVIGGEMIALLAEYLAQMLQGTDPENPANYTETAVNHENLGRLTMTLQRQTGKTPHELRRDAEAERDALILALHDAIVRPSGVVPDSASRWYKPYLADSAEARRPKNYGPVSDPPMKAF